MNDKKGSSTRTSEWIVFRLTLRYVLSLISYSEKKNPFVTQPTQEPVYGE